LKNLRDKAEDRNEDEFYFGMMSRQGPGSRLQGGRHWKGTVSGDRGSKVMDMDTVRLLKTQDRGYVRTMRQVTTKKVERLEQQLVMTRGMDHLDDDEEGGEDFDDDDDDFMFDLPSKPTKAPRKIVFLDDEEEREDALDQAEEEKDKQLAKPKPAAEEAEEGEETEQEKSLRRLRRELERERKKLKVLTDVEQQLEEQKTKMAKTATSGGETRRGQKIKVRTRKR
jgi:U3 small nucleolar RNA-associated protein 11